MTTIDGRDYVPDEQDAAAQLRELVQGSDDEAFVDVNTGCIDGCTDAHFTMEYPRGGRILVMLRQLEDDE